MDRIIDVLYGGRTAWREDAVRKAFGDAIRERYSRIDILEQKVNDERNCSCA